MVFLSLKIIKVQIYLDYRYLLTGHQHFYSLTSLFATAANELTDNPIDFNLLSMDSGLQDRLLNARTINEMLYPYWSSFKHDEQGVADKLNKGKKYVVSSNLKKAPWENTTILNNDFSREVEKLKREDGGYILVQGIASLLKPLLEGGLVDELRLLVNPAIIGTGEMPASEISGFEPQANQRFIPTTY
jgi:dihydrofolate reductase